MLTKAEIVACSSLLRMRQETIDWIVECPQSVLLVDESPGPRNSPELPLFPGPSGSAGDRLRAIVGLGRDTYLAFFERVNLIQRHVSHWPVAEAVASAWHVLERAKGRPVILLGNRVAAAVAAAAQVAEPIPFGWVTLGEVACGSAAVRIPHPAGVCRSYSDPDIRKSARIAVAESFKRALPIALGSMAKSQARTPTPADA